MVVGGGDSAMEEANFLTRFGSEMTLVHRRESFRASKIMLDRARSNPKIKFLLNTVVEDIYDVSKNTVTGVKLRDVSTSRVWDQDVTASSWPSATFPTRSRSWGRSISTRTATSSRRAARGPISKACFMQATYRIAYRQAITAAGAGCMAAIEAERFLEAEGH